MEDTESKLIVKNSNPKERRYITIDEEIETRATVDEETKQRVIAGYASVFNRKSLELTEYIREGVTGNYELRTFTETISPSAFDTADLSDLTHNVEHNDYFVIGRVGANTRVSVDDKGLGFKTRLPSEAEATTNQNDTYKNTSQRIYTASSFSFRIAQDGDQWTRKIDGKYDRVISKIERVYDVTTCLRGAYPDAYTFKRTLENVIVEQPEPVQPVEVPAEQPNEVEVMDSDFEILKLQ